MPLTHDHPRVWPLLSGRAICQVFGGGLRWLLLAKKEGLLLFLGSGSFGIDYRKIRSNIFDGLYVKFHIARRQSLRRWRRWAAGDDGGALVAVLAALLP